MTVAVIALVLFAVGGALSYSEGLKKQKPWARPALAVCAVGAYFALVKLFYLAVVVLLLAGVIAAYIKGVKKQQAWGNPAVAACTAGIVLALGVHYLWPRRGPAGPETTMARSDAAEVARLIGEGLKPHLGKSARIFVFYPPDQGGLGGMKRRWRDGLAEGLGEVQIEIVGYSAPDQSAVPEGMLAPGPGVYYAAAFNKVLEGVPGKLDAVVSFAGVPADVSEMRVHPAEGAPVLGAFFATGPNVAFDEALRGGQLKVAVIVGNQKLEAYTPTKLPPWFDP